MTLSWGEPFNNLDPIMSYTVSCSGDVSCPPNFITTDNTTRSYTITNLTQMTNYTFSVVATNSIGSGEAGVVMISACAPPVETIITITATVTTLSLVMISTPPEAINIITSFITTTIVYPTVTVQPSIVTTTTIVTITTTTAMAPSISCENVIATAASTFAIAS